jgi:hypothetical protein
VRIVRDEILEILGQINNLEDKNIAARVLTERDDWFNKDDLDENELRLIAIFFAGFLSALNNKVSTFDEWVFASLIGDLMEIACLED